MKEKNKGERIVWSRVENASSTVLNGNKEKERKSWPPQSPWRSSCPFSLLKLTGLLCLQALTAAPCARHAARGPSRRLVRAQCCTAQSSCGLLLSTHAPLLLRPVTTTSHPAQPLLDRMGETGAKLYRMRSDAESDACCATQPFGYCDRGCVAGCGRTVSTLARPPPPASSHTFQVSTHHLSSHASAPHTNAAIDT
jgi:hypothetical protein